MSKFIFILKSVFIFLTLIKSINPSECLDINDPPEASLSNCTKVIISEDTQNNKNNLQCCFLLIRQESGGDVRKCIEIKRDEDEIEKRIDALELMYTNAEDISIECLYGNYIKFLPNILFFLICLYF